MTSSSASMVVADSISRDKRSASGRHPIGSAGVDVRSGMFRSVLPGGQRPAPWEESPPAGFSSHHVARVVPADPLRVAWRPTEHGTQLTARADLELPIYLPEVVIDGCAADVQLAGDLLVRVAVGRQPGNLQLLRRQVLGRLDAPPPNDGPGGL